VDVRRLFFRFRSYTPIPLIVLALIFARPSWRSFGAGLGMMLFGEVLRFWGVAFAGSATRTTGQAGGDRLITDGPFGYVRNPLYLGNFFLSLGYLVMTWAWMPWMLVVLTSLFGLQYGFIVHLEEEYLSKRFGSEYDHYRRSVRRWIPRLFPYPASQKSLPCWGKALRSERNTLQAIVAVTALLVVRWHVL